MEMEEGLVRLRGLCIKHSAQVEEEMRAIPPILGWNGGRNGGRD